MLVPGLVLLHKFARPLVNELVVLLFVPRRHGHLVRLLHFVVGQEVLVGVRLLTGGE